MRSTTLRVDLAIAVAAAIILILVAPGLAIVALVALIVLLVSGISLVIERRRGRRQPAHRGRR